MQIGKSAATGIISRYRRSGQITTGRRGGYRKPKITEEIGEKIIDFVEQNPQCFIREIQVFLSQTEISCSRNTISRFLDGKLFTIKKAHGSVAERNSATVKESRYQYSFNYITGGWLLSQTIYIDETGFNLWTRRPNGRSILGTPCNITVPTNRGQNISLIMAIGRSGVIHHQLVLGSVNGYIYQKFIEEVNAVLDPNIPYRLIQDNAPIHKGIISLHTMVYLPPYSPFLNPIEAVFSKLKRDVRGQLSTSSGFLSMSQPERISALKSFISSAIEKDDYRDFTKYFRHCRKYL